MIGYSILIISGVMGLSAGTTLIAKSLTESIKAEDWGFLICLACMIIPFIGFILYLLKI